MTTTATIAPLLISNLQKKTREYCDAVDAVIELGGVLDDVQVRRLLALLQSADSTTRELSVKLKQLCVDSGWLERVSESKRTDKRERLPTDKDGIAWDHTVPVGKK